MGRRLPTRLDVYFLYSKSKIMMCVICPRNYDQPQKTAGAIRGSCQKPNERENNDPADRKAGLANDFEQRYPKTEIQPNTPNTQNRFSPFLFVCLASELLSRTKQTENLAENRESLAQSCLSPTGDGIPPKDIYPRVVRPNRVFSVRLLFWVFRLFCRDDINDCRLRRQ